MTTEAIVSYVNYVITHVRLALQMALTVFHVSSAILDHIMQLTTHVLVESGISIMELPCARLVMSLVTSAMDLWLLTVSAAVVQLES